MRNVIAIPACVVCLSATASAIDLRVARNIKFGEKFSVELLAARFRS
jgi:hypothetical protein